MKTKLLTICLLLYTSQVFAEGYYCTAELSNYNRPGETESKIYKREGVHFKRINSKNKISKFEITKETDNFIILTRTYKYPDIFVTIINKENMEFVEKYVTVACEQFDGCKGSTLKGKCLLEK